MKVAVEGQETLSTAERARPRLQDQVTRLVAGVTADRARLRLVAGLGGAVAVVAGLEASPLWDSLRLDIAALDFDPARTSLLVAWLACLVLAVLAGALSGRPWPSVATATAFFAVTYVAPWAWRAAAAPPVLFGSAERLSPPVLAGEIATMIAAGFLLTIPGAAGGGLVGAAAAGLRDHPGRGLAAIGAVALAAAATAVGVGPLVRYGPAADLYRPASGGVVPAGHVLKQTFRSDAMDGVRPYAVYLPASYERETGRRYPVVYLLHGDPGGYRDWLNLGIARLLDNGIASGSLPPLVAVMPDGNGTVTPAAQWANAWDGADRVEDSVLELSAIVDKEYRTVPDRRHRIVAGLSEGGFGAANLAARHPDVFGISISLSGYFTAQGPVFGNNPDYRLANSPNALVRAPGPARSVLYLLAAGDQDPRYLRTTEGFAHELDRLGIRHQLFVLPGGHDGGVWTAGLVLCLQAVKVQLETVR